jgi:hypothetical protein
MPDRRFPPPWYFEDIGTCFVVKDQWGQALAFVYYDKGLGPAPPKLATIDDDPPSVAAVES